MIYSSTYDYYYQKNYYYLLLSSFFYMTIIIIIVIVPLVFSLIIYFLKCTKSIVFVNLDIFVNSQQKKKFDIYIYIFVAYVALNLMQDR